MFDPFDVYLRIRRNERLRILEYIPRVPRLFYSTPRQCGMTTSFRFIDEFDWTKGLNPEIEKTELVTMELKDFNNMEYRTLPIKCITKRKDLRIQFDRNEILAKYRHSKKVHK